MPNIFEFKRTIVFVVFLGATLGPSVQADAQDGPEQSFDVTAKPGKITALNEGIFSIMSQSCRFVPRAMQVITQPTQGTVIPKMVKMVIRDNTGMGGKTHECQGVTVNALQILYRAKPRAGGTDELYFRTVAEEPPYTVSYYRYRIRFSN